MLRALILGADAGRQHLNADSNQRGAHVARTQFGQIMDRKLLAEYEKD